MTTFVAKSDLAHLGTDPIPLERYRSADYFDKERETIFRKVWLCVAHQSELPNPGDYLVYKLDVCKASIIVVRGRDGVVRAFHNVCSHRMAQVVSEERGNTPAFVCRYHGWMYGLDGALRNAPDEKNFWNLDKANCGLTAVSADISNGFIFINLDPQPKQGLKEFLAGIDEEIAWFDHDTRDYASFQVTAEIPVNWKCAIDNFQETYHVKFVHSRSVAGGTTNAENPFSHPTHFDFYGPHRTMGIYANFGYSPAEVELQMRMLLPHHKTSRGRPAGKHNNWTMEVHTLFPNVLIDCSDEITIKHEVIPITVDRSRLTSTFFFAPATNAGERLAQEYLGASTRDTAIEDFSILETIQMGMESGAKDVLHFQASEALCRHLSISADAYVRGVLPA